MIVLRSSAAFCTSCQFRFRLTTVAVAVHGYYATTSPLDADHKSTGLHRVYATCSRGAEPCENAQVQITSIIILQENIQHQFHATPIPCCTRVQIDVGPPPTRIYTTLILYYTNSILFAEHTREHA